MHNNRCNQQQLNKAKKKQMNKKEKEIRGVYKAF